MHRLLYLALIFLVSCQGVTSQDNNSSVITHIDERDKTTGFILAKSRISTDINAVYPFDIKIKDAEGQTHTTAKAFKKNGKPTVLLFWLTTCYPCGMEMKAISAKYTQWTKEADFNFYAISTDWPKNEAQFIKRVTKKNFPWETYWDFNKEFRHIMPGKLNGLPQVFLLDKNGKIVFHKRKYMTGDEDKLFEKIKSCTTK